MIGRRALLLGALTIARVAAADGDRPPRVELPPVPDVPAAGVDQAQRARTEQEQAGDRGQPARERPTEDAPQGLSLFGLGLGSLPTLGTGTAGLLSGGDALIGPATALSQARDDALTTGAASVLGTQDQRGAQLESIRQATTGAGAGTPLGGH